MEAPTNLTRSAKSMSHLVSHVLIRLAIYPALYWIGFAVVKGATIGNAIVMPYSEVGAEEGGAWWEFRIRRWGYKEWRPESMTIFGGLSVLLLISSCYVCRYFM